MQESGAGNDAKTEEEDVEGAVCAAVQGGVKDSWIYLGVSEFLFATATYCGSIFPFPDLFCGSLSVHCFLWLHLEHCS